MHYVPGKSVKAALRHMRLPSLDSEFNYYQVPDERLSRVHLVVLEFLRVRGPSMAQQVGDACYAQTHYDKEGLVNSASVRKRWANRVLHSLHHASRAYCDHEGKWSLLTFDSSYEMRTVSHAERSQIGVAVTLMLHASRDCMRNLKVDTTTIPFDVRDGYYGEAFGIMRALACLNYGTLTSGSEPYLLGNARSPSSKERDLRAWFRELEQQVLAEEHFGGNNECDFCVDRYGKDGAGRTRKLLEMNSMKKPVAAFATSFRYSSDEDDL